MNEERIGNFEKRTHRGRIWAGMFLLIIGGLLLLKSMNYILFPAWIFTWPVILIAIGLFSGVQHGFRGGFWLIMILIGGLFLLNDINPTLQLRRYIGPLAIIAIGLVFILKPRRHNWRRWKYGDAQNETNNTTGIPGNVTIYPTESTDRTDFIDITSVFSGVKKNILSKNFKGGDIVCFMGGSEINLTQADFTGRIKIDTTNIFGGTKLIVPPTWDVQSDVVCIFGGVDDKRQIGGFSMDPNKVLILDGTCMFGGIEIRSF